MFCPKCATQNMDGARFCRACGADISLVPQAMSGTLTQTQPTDLDALSQTGESIRRRSRRRQRGEPGIDKAIKSIFSGLGFLVVAIVLAFLPMGRGWWFWMFFPAFAMLGGGIAEIVRLRIEKGRPPYEGAPAAVPPATARAAVELPPRSTSELMPQPPSVTEGTTRHLGSEGPTEYLAKPRGKSDKEV